MTPRPVRNIAFVGTILLYGQILGYGFWVALGVVEEKSSRVVEVLLSTIPARALLAGKVIGIGLLGLLQLVLIAVIGLVAASLTGTIELDANAMYPVVLVLAGSCSGTSSTAACSPRRRRASRGRRRCRTRRRR